MRSDRLLCDAAKLDWSQSSGPRASAYGDVYFSVEDGLEETRAVFLQACGLPDAWQARDVFTVGELGFGTGLNALALWSLWRDAGNRDGWLHMVSLEKHPLTRTDAARAFAQWPALKHLSDHLLAQWPGLFKGPHRMVFPEDRFSITVFQDEAEAALAQMDASIDAWFLDGFAPACNEAMWSQGVFDAMGRLSAKGARVGTFTVAGAVRRGLAAAGFKVSKQPGFGKKRERLEAVYAGAGTARNNTNNPVCILGAGIAGASLAHALSRRGRSVRIIDPRGIAGGASGAPAGLLTPRLEKADRPHVRATLAAFDYARQLYDGMGVFRASGVERIAKTEAEAARFEALADLMGDGYHWREGGLAMEAAGWFEPGVVVRALLGDVPVMTDGGAEPGEQLIHATGPAFDLDGDITPSAGQVGVFAGDAPARPLSWGGYLAPTPSGDVLLGATHVKGWEDDTTPSALNKFHDDLTGLRPDLAARITPGPTATWAGVRASTPDRLPVAGRLPDGAYVLTGLGSRGFAHAPLLAEDLVSAICGEPRALERAAHAVFAPARFAERRARRGG